MAIREPEIIRNKEQMRNWSLSMKTQGKTIGLVPSMGYLHQAHLSLVTEARKHAQLIVFAIYVNPAQFSPTEDFSTYPSDFQGDIEKLQSIPNGVDVVVIPEAPFELGDERERSGGKKREKVGEVLSCLEMEIGGRNGHETRIRVEKLENRLCGKDRPVKFRGVATAMAKAFNVIQPNVVVFGKKDYQQWRIVERMVRDLDFPVKVIGAELIRDEDGLALSSRNVNLLPQEREQALSINRSLFEAKSAAKNGKTICSELRSSVMGSIEAAGGKVVYVEIVDKKSLEPVEEIKSGEGVVMCVAARFGKVRLLDNIEIEAP